MTETVANPTTSAPPDAAPASGPALPPVPSVRRGGDYQSMRSAQGPLQELPGRWVGRGFNLIARPDFAARSVPPGPGDKSALFLELNFTSETLKFDSIGSPIPNRGFDQNDIELHGVHYLQQIADLNTGGALHLEPGIWINIPKTTEPSGQAAFWAGISTRKRRTDVSRDRAVRNGERRPDGVDPARDRPAGRGDRVHDPGRPPDPARQHSSLRRERPPAFPGYH